MEHVELGAWVIAISIIKLITVAFGITFVYFAMRAWRKHRHGPMLLLAIGITFLTLGLVAEGFTFILLGMSMEASHIIEASFALIGFLFLVSSIATVRTHRVRRRMEATPDETESPSGSTGR